MIKLTLQCKFLICGEKKIDCPSSGSLINNDNIFGNSTNVSPMMSLSLKTSWGKKTTYLLCCENKLESLRTAKNSTTNFKLLLIYSGSLIFSEICNLQTLQQAKRFSKSKAQLSYKHHSQNSKHLTKVTLHLCVSPLRLVTF